MYRSPTNRHTRWRTAALLAAFVLGFFGSGFVAPSLLAQQQGTQVQTVWRQGSLRPTDPWNTLVVDMTIKRRHVNGQGATVGVPSPAASYRLERSMASGAWKTVLTVLSMEHASLYSLDGLLGSPAPLAVARIEDDEDGSPVRAFDSLGRRLRLPDLAAPDLAASVLGSSTAGGAQSAAGASTTYHVATTSWIDAFVAMTANAGVRQQKLESEFGKASAMNGLVRFAKTQGQTTAEVLAMAQVVIPVESNVSENATLMAHRTFTYRQAFSGGMVRSAVHTENRVSATNSDRLITDTSFANVALERR